MRSLLAALSLTIAVTLGAHAADPYTVANVRIDAEAANALEAQTLAMQEGQAEAARRLIARLTLPEDRMETVFDRQPYLNEAGEMVSNPQLDPALVSEMISGLEIQDEQRSATRYLANLVVSFDPNAVERVFEAYGVPFVEAQARPTLVLPVYDGSNGFSLWQDNPWQDGWASQSFANALTPMILPGDDAGAIYLSPRQALSLDEAALRQVAALYGVNRMAILRAQNRDGIRRMGGYLLEINGAADLAVESWGPVQVSGSWEDAATQFVLDREAEWKRQSVVRDGDLAEVRLTIIYSGLEEWRSLQSAVTGASLIEDARLDAMSRDGALMTVNYRGLQSQLINELAERGAVLEEHPGLGWVVRAAF